MLKPNGQGPNPTSVPDQLHGLEQVSAPEPTSPLLKSRTKTAPTPRVAVGVK